MTRCTAFVLCFAAVIACSKEDKAISAAEKQKQGEEAQRTELAPAVDKHRATATKVMAGLRAADADALAAPPLTEPQPAPAKLVTKPVATQEDLEDVGVLLAIPGHFLPDAPDRGSALWPIPKRQFDVGGVGRLLETGVFDWTRPIDVNDAERLLTSFESMHHIVYVRVRDLVRPTSEAKGTTFTPGAARGDILIYALPAGTRVGGFPLDMKMSSSDIKTYGLANDKVVDITFREEFLKQLLAQLAAL